MLHIGDVLSSDTVVLNLTAVSENRVIQDLASLLAAKSGLDGTSIFEALLDREHLGSTGLGQGIAVPHARVPGLTTTYAAMARLARPVDFDASDGRPVDLVCVIIGPEGTGTEPLEVLASVCRALRKPETAAKLRQAGSTAEMCSALCEAG